MRILNKINNIILNLSYFLYLGIIIYLSSLFFIGYHNLDLSQNMRYLEEKLDIKLYDLGSDLKLRNSEEGYLLGAKQMITAYYLSLIASFFLGFNYSLHIRRKK